MRQQKDSAVGKRKHRRIAVRLPAFVYVDPDGVGLECVVEDISQGGVGLTVNDISVRAVFLLQLSPQVRRLCKVQWRAGDRLGASFLNIVLKPGAEPASSRKKAAAAEPELETIAV
jgi:hypothetical protein